VSKEVELRYSEAFKQQVVSEIARGRFGGPREAAEAYGIGGHETVNRWVKQLGRRDLLTKVVRVEKPGEPGEIRRLKERVRRLEKALADAHIDKALDQSFFEILCEQTGVDPQEFKKKHVGKVSTGGGEESGRTQE
jgi:transposase-like protein